MRIVSVGDLVVDLITPVHLPIMPFQHQETTGGYLEAGGGCNFDIMARRLGAEVSALGAIGTDIFGRELHEILHGEGIDLRGVTYMPNSKTCVVYDLIDVQTKEHVFIGTLAEGDVVPFTQESYQLVASADALFVQGYNLHERQLPEVLYGALHCARENGVPIFCDVGPTIRTFEAEVIQYFLNSCDVLLMTEDELPLAARGLKGERAYAYLFEQGAQALVIKRGAAGCLVILPDLRLDSQGFEVLVADTVGAGDCFDAGFIFARLAGLDWEGCAVVANAVGACAVQRAGCGRNAPTRAEVEHLLRPTHIRLPKGKSA